MKSLYSELLLKFGTIDMLPNNPFYILGLPCEATPRQIRRRREDLEAAYEMGQKSWSASFPYLLEGSEVPSIDVVRNAFIRLDDIEERVVASLFWFWNPPEQDSNSRFDKAFSCFSAGEIENAESLWKELSCFEYHECHTFFLPNGGHGHGDFSFATTKCRHSVAAKHNLHVLNMLRAVLWELQNCNTNKTISVSDLKVLEETWGASSEPIEPVRKYRFKNADGEKVIDDGLPEGSWTLFQEKITNLDETRISTDFFSKLRIAFDDLPMMWHINFISSYAKADKWDGVNAHLRLIGDYLKDCTVAERIFDAFFGGMLERHRAIIERLNARISDNPSDGLSASNELIDSTTDDYNVIYAILGGEDSQKKLCIAREKLNEAVKNRKYSNGYVLMSRDELKYEKEVEWRTLHLRIQESLYDPVVKACFNYLFKYSEATKDWRVAIEWDEFLSKLAVSDKLKDTINKDLMSIFRVQVNDLIEQCAARVKCDSNLGLVATRELLNKSKIILETLGNKCGHDSAIAREIRNNIVRAARAFLIAYGNATSDWVSCLNSIKELRAIAEDVEVLALLESDQKTVLGNAKQALADKRLIGMCKSATEASPASNIFWVAVLIIVTAIMILVYNESSRVAREQSRYDLVDASVTKVEEWERVRKTRSGMVRNRKLCYKCYYEYLVGGRTYSGSVMRDEVPKGFISVYYDPERPSFSTTVRQTSTGASVGMVVTICISVILIPLNIILFIRKMYRRCGKYSG